MKLFLQKWTRVVITTLLMQTVRSIIQVSLGSVEIRTRGCVVQNPKCRLLKAIRLRWSNVGPLVFGKKYSFDGFIFFSCNLFTKQVTDLNNAFLPRLIK